MAELLIRVGGQDLACLRRTLLTPGRSTVDAPDRIVVDAHVATSVPAIADVARRAGAPMLVDPQTYYLQDTQHTNSPWALLPFASPAAMTPSELTSVARVDLLVERCLQYQAQNGATTLIPPYIHIERWDDGWPEVQRVLWHRTRRYLDSENLTLPTIALVSLGWRLLDQPVWQGAYRPLIEALSDLGPDEVALAASRIDMGAYPDQRLSGFVAMTRSLSRHFPTIAWQQGVLGEAAVAAGACGYETGIGWRERCNIPSAMRLQRAPSNDVFSARPVYIPDLMRSIPKSSVRSLLADGQLKFRLACTEYSCCPSGLGSLLADSREHAIRRRAQSLRTLSRTDEPSWRWSYLAENASKGLDLANRINRKSEELRINRVATEALSSIQIVANSRRRERTRRGAVA